MRLLFLVLVLAACAYSHFKPATVTAPPDAFARSSRVLIERGEMIETKDESAGVLITKWQEDTVIDLKRRYRWKVTTTGAALTVDSQCQEFEKNNFTGGGDWKDCATQPDARSETAKTIAQAILDVQVAARPVEAKPAASNERKTIEGDQPLHCTVTAPDVGLCFLDAARCDTERTQSNTAACEERKAGSCFNATKTLDGTKATVCAVSIKDCETRRGAMAADADFSDVTPCGIYRMK
jgi:hypothetical protein